jgi:hypothetical protein
MYIKVNSIHVTFKHTMRSETFERAWEGNDLPQRQVIPVTDYGFQRRGRHSIALKRPISYVIRTCLAPGHVPGCGSRKRKNQRHLIVTYLIAEVGSKSSLGKVRAE